VCFPRGWADRSDRFRDEVRHFWHDQTGVGRLAAGSGGRALLVAP
jgi:pullulanase/glycogen debranching enzyme